MTITQQLMRPGQWSISLRRDAPYSVYSAVQEMDHVVVTPVRFDPRLFTDANVLAMSIFTGVAVDITDPFTLTGPDLSHWLGTANGVGYGLATAYSGNAANLATWVNLIRPPTVGAGTVTSPGTTHTATYQWMTAREKLDAITRALGAEWRLNPNNTLDAAVASTLFVTTPKVMITPREEGQDGTLRGLEATAISPGRNADQLTSRVYIIGAGMGSNIISAIASTSTGYSDFFGAALAMDRLVDAPEQNAASGAQTAIQTLAQFSTPRFELSLSSRTYNVTRLAKPGDYVYVFDPTARLYDAANQVLFRGEMTFPIKLRAYGVTWPVEEGMGVYARRYRIGDAGASYTDLSDYVQFENGTDVSWEIGSMPLPFAEWAGGA